MSCFLFRFPVCVCAKNQLEQQISPQTVFAAYLVPGTGVCRRVLFPSLFFVLFLVFIRTLKEKNCRCDNRLTFWTVQSRTHIMPCFLRPPPPPQKKRRKLTLQKLLPLQCNVNGNNSSLRTGSSTLLRPGTGATRRRRPRQA